MRVALTNRLYLALRHLNENYLLIFCKYLNVTENKLFKFQEK